MLYSFDTLAIEWRLAAKQLVREDAKAPYVDILRVFAMHAQLRCHVQRRAHDERVLRVFLATLREAEVRDLNAIV